MPTKIYRLRAKVPTRQPAAQEQALQQMVSALERCPLTFNTVNKVSFVEYAQDGSYVVIQVRGRIDVKDDEEMAKDIELFSISCEFQGIEFLQYDIREPRRR